MTYLYVIQKCLYLTAIYSVNFEAPHKLARTFILQSPTATCKIPSREIYFRNPQQHLARTFKLRLPFASVGNCLANNEDICPKSSDSYVGCRKYPQATYMLLCKWERPPPHAMLIIIIWFWFVCICIKCNKLSIMFHIWINWRGHSSYKLQPQLGCLE